MNIVKCLDNRKGVTIIAVLFVLIVIGMLGIAVSKLTVNQQTQTAKTIQVQDAYYTARSGLEWAYQYMTDMGYDNIANLAGTYTLPNGQAFTITTGTTSVTSTAVVGGTERSITFAAFGSKFLLTGSTCTVASNNGLDLFDSSVASSAKIIDPDGVLSSPSTVTSTQSITLPVMSTPDVTYNGAYQMTSALTLNASGTDAEIYFDDKLELKDSSTLTVNGPTTIYVADDFKMKDSSSLIINGEVRFVVSNDAKFQDNANVTINSGGSLLVMATNKVEVKDTANVNGTGNAGDLLLMGNDVKLKDSALVAGGLYAEGKVELKADGNILFSGAVVGGTEVKTEIKSGSLNVTYDSTAGDTVISGTLGVC